MKVKWKIGVGVFIAVLLGIVFMVWRQGSGATHGEILDAVREQGALTRACVERQATETQRRLDAIEDKLDRLLKIAERPLPDGITVE